MPTVVEYAEICESWSDQDRAWYSWGWVPGGGPDFDRKAGLHGMAWVNKLAQDGWRVVARAATDARDGGPGYSATASRDIWTLERRRET